MKIGPNSEFGNSLKVLTKWRCAKKSWNNWKCTKFLHSGAFAVVPFLMKERCHEMMFLDFESVLGLRRFAHHDLTHTGTMTPYMRISWAKYGQHHHHLELDFLVKLSWIVTKRCHKWLRWAKPQMPKTTFSSKTFSWFWEMLNELNLT